MIEKIGLKGFKTLSSPAGEVIELINILKEHNKPLTVAEVGIGIGATSVKILELLTENDTVYLFDYQRKIDELVEDLKGINNNNVSIIGVGNSEKLYDSYSWNLATMLLNRRNAKKSIPLFDLVYLDGAHAFLHDSTACCVLKDLTKNGGYLVFDDMHWSYANSPTQNPKANPKTNMKFTEDQINTAQISMVVDLFMRHDKDWVQIYLNNNLDPDRAVFKKKNGQGDETLTSYNALSSRTNGCFVQLAIVASKCKRLLRKLWV